MCNGRKQNRCWWNRLSVCPCFDMPGNCTFQVALLSRAQFYGQSWPVAVFIRHCRLIGWLRDWNPTLPRNTTLSFFCTFSHPTVIFCFPSYTISRTEIKFEPVVAVMQEGIFWKRAAKGETSLSFLLGVLSASGRVPSWQGSPIVQFCSPHHRPLYTSKPALLWHLRKCEALVFFCGLWTTHSERRRNSDEWLLKSELKRCGRWQCLGPPRAFGWKDSRNRKNPRIAILRVWTRHIPDTEGGRLYQPRVGFWRFCLILGRVI